MYSISVKQFRSLFYCVEPCFIRVLRIPDLVRLIPDRAHHHRTDLITMDRDTPTITGLGTTHTRTTRGDRLS
jgi:hypothetical protein